jgi:hypothetical protein
MTAGGLSCRRSVTSSKSASERATPQAAHFRVIPHRRRSRPSRPRRTGRDASLVCRGRGASRSYLASCCMARTPPRGLFGQERDQVVGRAAGRDRPRDDVSVSDTSDSAEHRPEPQRIGVAIPGCDRGRGARGGCVRRACPAFVDRLSSAGQGRRAGRSLCTRQGGSLGDCHVTRAFTVPELPARSEYGVRVLVIEEITAGWTRLLRASVRPFPQGFVRPLANVWQTLG